MPLIFRIPALGHAWSEWGETKPAAEEEDGEEERICERCQKKETRPIPKKDHVHHLIHIEEIPADCTHTGVKEHWFCETCRRYFGDSEGADEISEETTVIPVKLHRTERRRENEIAPTCTMKGAYDIVIHCTVCDETISRTTVSVPATGHDWDQPEYTWSEDNTVVKAEVICLHDITHVQEETVPAASMVVKKAACTEEGEIRYRAEFENSLFETQQKTESIPPSGHDWNEPNYFWSEDYSSVRAERICRNDSSHSESETVTAEKRIVKEPTKTESGLAEYTAVFTNPAFEKQVKEKILPPTGETVYYYCASGEGGSWTKGTKDRLRFTYKRSVRDEVTFTHFDTLSVDGNTLNKSDYTAAPGSVVIELLPGYLETLAVGEHVLLAGFDDGGSEEIRFKVKAKKKEDDGGRDESSPIPVQPQKPPKNKVVNTEDTAHIGMWSAVFAASLISWALSLRALLQNRS